jgi:predicted Zn finger-like uncharacterized protein
MRIHCPICEAAYQVPVSRVIAAARLRCGQCKTVFTPSWWGDDGLQSAGVEKSLATAGKKPRAETGETPPGGKRGTGPAGDGADVHDDRREGGAMRSLSQ